MDLIEEAVCEGEVRLDKACLNYDPELGRLMPFVWGVLTNVVREVLRAYRNRPVDTRQFAPRVDIAEDPCTVACRNEALARLNAVFNDLSTEDRVLLARKYGSLFGLPQPEGRWSPNDSTRLCRLLKRLRALLGDSF